jgi:hypothetical protein
MTCGVSHLVKADVYDQYVYFLSLVPMTKQKLLFRIRAMIVFFVALLLLSGITAFPLYAELKWITDHHVFSSDTAMGAWLYKVWLGVKDINDKNAFLFYGYDWLAFAHIVIGLAFIGPFTDPVRNKWTITWAIIACIGVLPLALIAGNVRGIPGFHILIDCCFGIFGILPLLLVRKWIRQLERIITTAL